MDGEPEYQDASDVRVWQRDAAAWVKEFAASGYGPNGGAKVVDGETITWLESPASTLRELGPVGPFLAPYHQLATSVGQAVGDQTTGALLLASNLVAELLRAQEDGLPPPEAVRGIALAQRQVLGALSSLRSPDPEGKCLKAISEPLARTLVPYACSGNVDLDALQIVDGLEGLALMDAIHVDAPIKQPWTRTGTLAILSAGPVGAIKGAEASIRRWQQVQGLQDQARDKITAWIATLRHQNVALVVSNTNLGDAADAARAEGIIVWDAAPQSAIRRLEEATGARIGPTLADATGANISLTARRQNGWWARGTGPAATLVLQPSTHPEVGRDEAERFLRALGAWLEDRSGVPGDGRWQQSMAASLRRAADVAPGRTPMAIEAIARAFDEFEFALRRNAGRDPLDDREATDSVDAAACVRVATASAFEAARQILRVDAMWRKRSSTQLDLRGSNQRPGSPKGMPGDIPPLM